MSKAITGVEYEDGHMTGVHISGILEAGVEEPVTAYFRRVVYGKWYDMGFYVSCSVCDHSVFIGTKDPVVHKSEKVNLNFCPHCGAEMLLED